MCGIAGWAHAAPDEARLRGALRALAHRGPDGEGIWSSPRASLGHRRLSIIDLSTRASQPMGNQDGSVQVVFNGEIYNFQELRQQLIKKHPFVSASDTEVLVHGYREWGLDGLVDRIAGMFAFALWDERRAELHLVRDRLGKKPLYYSLLGGGLTFASTLPAMLALLRSTPALRTDALADYLHYQSVPGDKSLLEGVHKLLPAHRGTFDGKRLLMRRYWTLSFAHQERRSEAEWLAQIDETARRATAARMVADVPLGVFLSGGVDSSLVTALMAAESGQRLTTISAGFEEQELSELTWAGQVARHLGTNHHEAIIRPRVADDLPWMVYASGEPLADAALLPTMWLSRLARQHVTVVLTGDGGDEAFAGYPSALLARAASIYAALPAGLRSEGIPALLQRVPAGGVLARGARMGRRLAEAGRPPLAWHHDPLAEKGFRGRLGEILHPAVRARLGGYNPDWSWDAGLAAADGPTFADRVLALEATTLLPDQLLVKGDVASMSQGIELRSPLLDVALHELAARIPIAMKLKHWQRKYLLKALARRRLPHRAVMRRKQGFSVPLSAWLRGPLAKVAAHLLAPDGLPRRGLINGAALIRLREEHAAGGQDHGQRLWSLMLLELWMRVVVDRSMAPGDSL